MTKITRWNKMILMNIIVCIGFITVFIMGNLEGFFIMLISMMISIILRLDLGCPSCNYMIDRSRLGPVVLFPGKICRCGQDKTIDEAEPVKVRNARRDKERNS